MPGQAKALADAESLLGEELPAHARPTVARALRVSVVWLALWLIPVAAIVLSLGPHNTFSQIALFFSKMATVTFGGAYAVLAYVAQQAVETYGWVKPGEMLDGLGMAETTPGPLIMVTQFVGFMGAYRNPGQLTPMLAGTLGGLLTTWVTFTPCFLWIFLGAPFVEALRGNRALNAALSAVTAAVVGVILNLAVWFALHAWFLEAHAGARAGVFVRRTDPGQRSTVGGRAFNRRDACRLPLQGWHADDARGMLARGRDSVHCRRNRVSSAFRKAAHPPPTVNARVDDGCREHARGRAAWANAHARASGAPGGPCRGRARDGDGRRACGRYNGGQSCSRRGLASNARRCLPNL